MVLNQPTGMANIPNVLKSRSTIIPIGYGSSETGQNENYVNYAHTGGSVAWETAYTVPTGKTLYVTDFLVNGNSGAYKIGVGATPDVLFVGTASSSSTDQYSFSNIPIKLTAGSVIKFYGRETVDAHVLMIIGWEE